MKKPAQIDRRRALEWGLRGAAVLGFADLTGGGRAGAQTANRIAVCIYLLGGNDGNNMIIPLRQYSKYLAARGALAISPSDLLPAHSVSAGEVAFHPAMAPIRDLFQSGVVAVTANVGDQTPLNGAATEFAYFPQGYFAPKWAAQIAGSAASGLVSGFGGSQELSLLLLGPGASSAREKILRGAASGGFNMPFPNSGIGQQLLQVARTIRSGASGGIRPQIFSAVQSGYSTRTNQLIRQAALLGELSEAMSAFYAATVEMGVARSVTTFTDSDFGRTLTPNKTGGSNPGWGSHQLVMGGSVLGGEIYGAFPDLTLGGGDDATGFGAWKPSIAKQQYAATVAAWAGVSNLRSIFPAIDGASASTLGFMS